MSRKLVHAGLAVVRFLLKTKAVLFRSARHVASALRPIGKFIISTAIVPIYRTGFASRRQIAHWYRPAKNRTMFFLTNRAMMHIAIIGVMAGTVAMNLGMDTVRAETVDAFNKSLAYAVVTQEDSPIVEEYADMDPASLRADATSYLSHASLVAPLGAIDGTGSAFMNSASLAGGGGLSAPVISGSSASVAPREGIETYTVTEGDTLSTIAARFGISINTLLWANNLSVRSVLKLNQQLSILPVSGVVHTVKNGDTLTKIASTYNGDATSILSANKLSDAGAIALGQKLLIPGGVPPTPVAVKRPTSVASVFTPAPKTSSGTKKPTGSARMIWPATGHYIVRGLSWYHTGVDIDCNGHGNGTSTEDNYAAADGIVQFSGWKSGYGNVVEINHGNGLITRYGHHFSLYVHTGEQITAGTPIGRCGSTGSSTGTHLHFEIIGSSSKRDYRNPLEYIR